MGREVRRVPLDWQHPTNERGHYIPLYEESYTERAAEWLAELLSWNDGTHPMLATHPERKAEYPFYWDYDDGPPDKESYRQREWTPEEASGWQMYENVTEGTPLSPVFATADELVAWLITTQGYSETASRSFVQSGYAPSMVLMGGAVYMGIEALDHM